MPRSLYAFIWQSSRRQQVWLVLLTLIVAPMSMIPLELQRRIVDDAIHDRNLRYMFLLCGLYLAILLAQGGLKYLLNVYRGRLVEHVAFKLRGRVFAVLVDEPLKRREHATTIDKGAVVSITSFEFEEVARFVGDSISFPLLQAGTAFGTLGYLFWVQPEIAAFAVALFTPQIVIGPWGCRINHWAAIHTRLLRKLGAIVSSEKNTLTLSAASHDCRVAR
jgi:ABC-type multidrug transport system fused ATPase/permease subunit